MGSDYTKNGGWLESSLAGEITVPRTGWKYWTGGSGWRADDTLSIDY